MNKVQQAIYEKVVEPAINQIAGALIGTVTDFDPVHHLATVEYSSDESETTQKAAVPYNVTPGLKKHTLFPGDEVLLLFINNSYKRPVIIDILDKEHAFETRPNQAHPRKGGHVSEYYSAREGEHW